MIKLQPGYHCYLCPCFVGERDICQILKTGTKRDCHDRFLPAMPLAECPLELMILTEAAGDVYTNPQIMGIFDENEYDQWLDQEGDQA